MPTTCSNRSKRRRSFTGARRSRSRPPSSWAPLRVTSVSLPAGSELAIVDDGCSGTTFYGLDGCYVTLNFTPQTLGTHRMTLFVDANANTKEIYMLGTGLE